MLCFALESSKEGEYDIIGRTHLHTEFNIFRTKNCCPYYITLVWCVTRGTTFFIYFPCFLDYTPIGASALCALGTSCYARLVSNRRGAICGICPRKQAPGYKLP